MPPPAGGRPWTRPVITETRADNFTRIREPMYPSVRPGQRPHGRMAQSYWTGSGRPRVPLLRPAGVWPDAARGWRPPEDVAGNSRDPRRQLHRYPVAETSSGHAGAAWRAPGTGAHRPRASSRGRAQLPQNHPADFAGARRRQAGRRPDAYDPSPWRPCHPGGRDYRHRPRHRDRAARGPAPGRRVHGAVGLVRDRRLWADHGEAAAVSYDRAHAGNQGLGSNAGQRPGRRGDHPLQRGSRGVRTLPGFPARTDQAPRRGNGRRRLLPGPGMQGVRPRARWSSGPTESTTP